MAYSRASLYILCILIATISHTYIHSTYIRSSSFSRCRYNHEHTLSRTMPTVLCKFKWHWHSRIWFSHLRVTPGRFSRVSSNYDRWLRSRIINSVQAKNRQERKILMIIIGRTKRTNEKNERNEGGIEKLVNDLLSDGIYMKKKTHR